MELGSNIENNLNNFKFVFNEKEGWSRSDEPKQKASFSVIDGSDITLYESRLTTKEAREKILKNLNGVNTKRVFEIVEPDIIYNFYLFEDKIVAAFEKPKNCIIISGLKLLDRYKNISRYSVCATTYPKIIDVLYEDFSLKNLYNAYINGDDNEKEIIKEFIKLLNFEKKKQTQNFKDLILLAEKQDLFNNMFYPTKRNQKNETIILLRNASLNNSIIENFNLDERVFDIDLKGDSYADSVIEEKNKNKKYPSKWIK